MVPAMTLGLGLWLRDFMQALSEPRAGLLSCKHSCVEIRVTLRITAAVENKVCWSFKTIQSGLCLLHNLSQVTCPSLLYPGGFFSVKHNWETLTEAIQNHIGSLNWGYRLSLRERGVAYVNSYGEFVEHHTIKVLVESLVVFFVFT